MKVIHDFDHPSDTALPIDTVTCRELEVLRLIARGMSNQEIAQTLVIHERTIAKYVSSILNKLHVANRTQAALYAIREGLLASPINCCIVELSIFFLRFKHIYLQDYCITWISVEATMKNFEYITANAFDRAWLNFELDLPLKPKNNGGPNPFYIDRPGNPIAELTDDY